MTEVEALETIHRSIRDYLPSEAAFYDLADAAEDAGSESLWMRGRSIDELADALGTIHAESPDIFLRFVENIVRGGWRSIRRGRRRSNHETLLGLNHVEVALRYLNLESPLVTREVMTGETGWARSDPTELPDSQEVTWRDLSQIKMRLGRMRGRPDRSRVGYLFERLLCHWLDLYDLDVRPSFATRSEQTDATFRCGGQTYLLEAKSGLAKTNGAALVGLGAKVVNKSRTAMGVFVSLSGYTKEAAAKLPKPVPLILIDGRHLDAALPADEGTGWEDLDAMITRLHRFLDDEGEPLGPPTRVGR